jgi:hypothetical protein
MSSPIAHDASRYGLRQIWLQAEPRHKNQILRNLASRLAEIGLMSAATKRRASCALERASDKVTILAEPKPISVTRCLIGQVNLYENLAEPLFERRKYNPWPS